MIEIDYKNLIKFIASNKRDKSMQTDKLSVRRITEKNGEESFLCESFEKDKTYQKICAADDVQRLLQQLTQDFKQINVFYPDRQQTVLYSKKGAEYIKTNYLKTEKTESAHNREKNYILKEGQPIPAFIDLGIFTAEYKVVASKYDKYKQINRFIEIIDDCYKNACPDNLRIIDFGCGKSYLTFFVYYYFTEIKKVNVKVTGYDLKEEVVADCNALAEKYGYKGLTFVTADISKESEAFSDADAVITLHACDTATDYALYYALKYRVKNIFSVPCCQHEINSKIKKGGDYDILLEKGLIKERFSALLTDSIRTEILESCGYSTDCIEFVDFAHSPKNLMLRARRQDGADEPPSNGESSVETESVTTDETISKSSETASGIKADGKRLEKIGKILEKYCFEQKLYKLINDKKGENGNG